MKTSSPSPENHEIETELVAYLDGELDGEGLRRVEDHLSHDGDYRRLLRQLQGTWDLLDELPRSNATEMFTQSTVEMVAVRAEEDMRHHEVAQDKRRLGRWLVGVAGIAAASVIGYFVGTAVWTSPDKQLIQDLPVIENVDAYLLAEDVEFLRSLDREGLFVEDSSDGR